MEIVLGALPSILPKLTELLKDEYSLQKEVKSRIRFLQDELETMQAALVHISKIPVNELPPQDKIWARNVRELSYDIEDNIDTFMVRVKGRDLATKHGVKKLIDKTLGCLMQPKIRRKIATDIRDIRSRVEEMSRRRDRYKINNDDAVPAISVDTRLMARYEKARHG